MMLMLFGAMNGLNILLWLRLGSWRMYWGVVEVSSCMGWPARGL